MWECSNSPYFWWMGGIFPGGVLSILIWGLIIFALVYLAVKLLGFMRSREARENRDRMDSLQILQVRYARGELNREEYAKIRETLSGRVQ